LGSFEAPKTRFSQHKSGKMSELSFEGACQQTPVLRVPKRTCVTIAYLPSLLSHFDGLH
jgi:hypothetical protein